MPMNIQIMPLCKFQIEFVCIQHKDGIISVLTNNSLYLLDSQQIYPESYVPFSTLFTVLLPWHFIVNLQTTMFSSSVIFSWWTLSRFWSFCLQSHMTRAFFWYYLLLFVTFLFVTFLRPTVFIIDPYSFAQRMNLFCH